MRELSPRGELESLLLGRIDNGAGGARVAPEGGAQQNERGTEFRDRFLQPPLAFERGCQIGVRRRRIGRDGERPAEGVRSGRVAFQIQIENAQGDVEIGLLRRQRNRALERPERLGQLARTRLGNAQHKIRAGVIRLTRQDCAANLERLAVFAALTGGDRLGQFRPRLRHACLAPAWSCFAAAKCSAYSPARVRHSVFLSWCTKSLQCAEVIAPANVGGGNFTLRGRKPCLLTLKSV